MKTLHILCLLLAVTASQPMLKAGISESLPKEFLNILLPFACGYLTNYELGNFTFTIPTPLGIFDVDLKNTTVDSVLLDFMDSGKTEMVLPHVSEPFPKGRAPPSIVGTLFVPLHLPPSLSLPLHLFFLLKLSPFPYFYLSLL